MYPGSGVTSRAQYQMAQQVQQNQIVTPQKLQELVKQIDENEHLDPDVASFLIEMAEEFVDNVTTFACNLAQHRKGDSLEVKDLQLHLERNWNIRIPGFHESASTAKKTSIPDTHKQRMDLVNKSQNAKR
eukprot:CAMPEP_0206206840 /NCGR_PEP_ID=MMETSP0166-20121206/15226_1 /ASSEMBLY_ACC=CAM_ASM_000260 /TAXON_ID=95228 /ORGANISM="Vannella robusta, Strain DIVA3 518/3/11/1/6" /LENGTH=129 /DNA_ID=CAMNT_0053627469 /DNA_START=134 /DNA_END=523 /DNA_ORIENTATION=-